MSVDGETSKPGSSEQTVAGIATNTRIPPIWRDRIRLWFVQFEAIVAPLKKGDQALYEVLIAQLERQDIDEISDLLLEPPETNKFQSLKNRLIAVYEDSQDRNLQRLLSEIELGDLKPSQLLRRMKTLAGKNVSETALRILWSNHLPASVRTIVAASDTIMKDVALSDIALMADKILEQTCKEISSLSVPKPLSSLPSTSQASAVPSSIESKLDDLAREVAELKMNNNRQFRRNERPATQFYATRSVRPRARSSFRNHDFSSPGICYYHRRFGDSAFKCTIPCSYKKREKREN